MGGVEMIKILRGTTSSLQSNNPILQDGQLGLERTEYGSKMKAGDGSTKWNSLPYIQVTLPEEFNNVQMHNNIYRGKDLTNVYTWDQISDMLNSNDFRDLYIGDYFDIHLSGPVIDDENLIKPTSLDDVFRFRIAHIDSSFPENVISAYQTTHWLTLVADNSIIGGKFYTTHPDPQYSGFGNSIMRTQILPALSNLIVQAIPNNHVMTYEKRYPNCYMEPLAIMNRPHIELGISYENNAIYTQFRANIMSEMMILGCPLYSSSLDETFRNTEQLSIFKLDQRYIYRRFPKDNVADNYWLSNMASADTFCYVDNTFLNMPCFLSDAEDNMRGVRPFIILT